MLGHSSDYRVQVLTSMNASRTITPSCQAAQGGGPAIKQCEERV